MLRIDFQDPYTLRLHEALSGAYSTKDAVVGLLQRTGFPPASYPDKATVTLSWQFLLIDLQTATQLDELLATVLLDRKAVEIHVVVEEFRDRTPRTSDVRIPNSVLDPSVGLLCKTLFRHLGDEAAPIARKLVDRLASENNNISGPELFEATRLAIEYHLLVTEDLSATLILDFAYGRKEKLLADFLSRLRKGLDARALGEVVLPVKHRGFFSRTLERKEDWSVYFETVHALSGTDSTIGCSLCRITTSGFLAPQFLVSGLLPRFEDNWGPIITEYENQIQDDQSAFVSFQASQWRTWLMWGPSIPICQCGEWEGIHAFQYGYGDENNSIPVIGAAGDLPGSLESIAGAYAPGDAGVAVLRPMTGRLRWAPWLLRKATHGEPPSGSGEFPLSPLTTYAAARAQRAIYEIDDEDDPDSSPEALLFQVEKLSDGRVPEQSYFSAYQWLMFLIAKRPERSGQAPRRLADGYPALNARSAGRSAKHLWRELLPIYVHANVADAKALAMHRRTLVHNTVGLLRQLWVERPTLFPGVDARELCFCLVGGSDYSGCGKQIRFPSSDPLLEQLRARVAAEAKSDRDFASAILLPPPDETPATRPPELTAFYSTCRLPDLVADYYRYVASLRNE